MEFSPIQRSSIFANLLKKIYTRIVTSVLQVLGAIWLRIKRINFRLSRFSLSPFALCAESWCSEKETGKERGRGRRGRQWIDNSASFNLELYRYDLQISLIHKYINQTICALRFLRCRSIKLGGETTAFLRIVFINVYLLCTSIFFNSRTFISIIKLRWRRSRWSLIFCVDFFKYLKKMLILLQ